jgi:hypothetical protein
VQIELTRSTIARNRARSAGGLFAGPNGTTLTMRNATVAENVALSSLAGGMAISSGVTGSIRNVTFARNEAPGPVAFAAATTGGQGVTLHNTIVDGHVAGNGWNPISCLHAFQEGGGNLQWPVARAGGGSDDPDALCSPAVQVADAQLGPLLEDASGMPTIAPGPASPALGNGSDCPPTDQLGRPRAPGSCDAGAIEAPAPAAGAAGGAAVIALATLRAARRGQRRSSAASARAARSSAACARAAPSR